VVQVEEEEMVLLDRQVQEIHHQQVHLKEMMVDQFNFQSWEVAVEVEQVLLVQTHQLPQVVVQEEMV
jgi:hypothetical protein